MAERRNKHKRPQYLVVEEELEKVTKKQGREIEGRLNGWTETNKSFFKKVVGELPKIKARNEKQGKFLKSIDDNEIILCTGPAGTGKSYLQVYKALELMLDPHNNFQEIMICTPAVEADEKLGFLPGDANEKLGPYTSSTFYLIKKIIGEVALKHLTDKKVITVMPFAYMRGINIDNTIVLGEEIQNTTIRQLKTFLTRIGEDSKFICSGDIEQNDREKKNFKNSGLAFAIEHIFPVPGMSFTEFGQEDIVRNPIISKILDKFREKGH